MAPIVRSIARSAFVRRDIPHRAARSPARASRYAQFTHSAAHILIFAKLYNALASYGRPIGLSSLREFQSALVLWDEIRRVVP